MAGTVANFGKYKGQNKTYEEIWLTDRDYCEWGMKMDREGQITKNSKLKKLVTWCIQAEVLEKELELMAQETMLGPPDMVMDPYEEVSDLTEDEYDLP